MAHSTDPADREALEILNMVDAIRRMLIDLPVERKRLVLDEVDKWISLEESGSLKPPGNAIEWGIAGVSNRKVAVCSSRKFATVAFDGSRRRAR